MPEPKNKSMTAAEYRSETLSEEAIHKAVVEWADRQAAAEPALEMLFHTPNGGSRHGAEAKKLKRRFQFICVKQSVRGIINTCVTM